jgi:hypothetical protein
MTVLTTHSSTRSRSRRRQSIEFRLIYAVSFVILLATVLVERLFRLVTWRAPSGPSKSILQETREAAGATVPYAFMG